MADQSSNSKTWENICESLWLALDSHMGIKRE